MREKSRGIFTSKILGESRIQSTEIVPEPAQLDLIFPVATVRARVSISIMAFSGVRPEVLGNIDGTDGLVLGDIPDLDIQALQFKVIPAQVIVRRALSKVRHQYFTFLNQKGCDYLLAYLKERVKEGEQLGPQTPVIKSDSRKKEAASLNKENIKYFVCTQNISEEIKRAIVRAGMKERPYVLRSYFASHLLQAELDNKMIRIFAPSLKAIREILKGCTLWANTT